MWIPILLAIVIGYLLGNINGAICISKLVANEDVRDRGSGNAGLTNYIRNYGTQKALSVVLIDGGKAVLACVAGGLLLKSCGMYHEGTVIGGVAVLVGHMFPVFLGFRGGKGILSGFFAAITIDWRIALLILAVFAAAYFITQYVSLGSVLAAITFGIGFVVFYHDKPMVMILGLAAAALVVFKHRENIVRLVKGQERKTNLFGSSKKK